MTTTAGPRSWTVAVLVQAVTLAIALPTQAAERCPAQGRAQLLNDQPASLLPCGNATDPLAHIWAAHALSRLDRHAESAPLYARLAARNNTLAPLLQLAAAQEAMAAGQSPQQALALLGASDDQGPSWLQARRSLHRMRWQLAAGNATGARSALDKASRLGAAAPALLLGQAESARLIGDVPDQRQAMEKLLVNHPASAEARQIETSPLASEILGGLAPAAHGKRWGALRSHGDAQTAGIQCLAFFETHRDRMGGDALLECGRALSTLRHARTAELLELAATHPATRGASLLALARVKARDNQPAPVHAVCEQLAAADARNEVPECRYLAALLELDHGDRKRGLEALADIARSYPRHERAMDARWIQAFAVWKDHPQQAFDLFDSLTRSLRDADDKARAFYWRARSRPASESAQARDDYTQAFRLDPHGYYGAMAAQRLGRPQASDRKKPVRSTPAAVPPELSYAQTLLEAGFSAEASRAIDDALAKKPRKPLSWLPFLERADRWDAVLKLARSKIIRKDKSSGAAEERLFGDHPLAYPHAWKQLPDGVDRYLMLSLMRRESLFNPDAVSSAQAHGLLQLLPVTAEKLSKELGLPAPTPQQLHNPATNIRLATHYVARLKARFFHPFVVSAAYNAGPPAVEKWLSAHAGDPVDLWVERIPFRETRAYVKAVAANRHQYQSLYAGRIDTLELDTLPTAVAGIDY